MLLVSQAKIKVNLENNSLFAVVTGSSELVEIFKYKKENNELVRINSIDINKAVLYKETHDQMKYIRTRKSKLGFASPCVTKDNIYVLYKNYTLGEVMKDRNKYLSKEVWSFDWKGNLVYKYQLVKNVESIYVFDNKLYALGRDKHYHSVIYAYKLDK